MQNTIAYLRVSTDAQQQDSQQQQIATWATASNLTVNTWYRDKMSGATRWQDRQISDALDAATAGDTIVVSEISRIARSTVGVLTFLQAAAAKSVNVHIVQQRMTIDSSLQSTIMVTIFAMVAEIERALNRDRTRAAIQSRRDRGEPVGRQPGTRVRSKLDQRRGEIMQLLEKKVSKRAITRILGCAPDTLYHWLRTSQPPSIDTHTLPLPGIDPPTPIPGTRPAPAAPNS